MTTELMAAREALADRDREIARLRERLEDAEDLRDADNAKKDAEVARLREAIREWHDGVIGGEHKLRMIAREGR